MRRSLVGRFSCLVVTLCSLTAVLTFLALGTNAASVEEIAQLKGPQRQKVLVEGAKKEGKLLWYTTLIINQAVRPLQEAFEKQYPFIHMEYFRGNSEQVAQKMIAEYQGRRFDVDLIDGTGSTPLLKKAGLIQRFYSPHLGEYPAELKDPQGYWGATNLYFMTLGYNTNLVKPDEVPATWEGLLNPKWKGKLVWSTSAGSGAPLFVGNTLLSLGQEAGMAYLTKLSKQSVVKTTASGRAVLDSVIAGEYPIAIYIFNHHAVISRKKGAPSEWQPLEPVAAPLQVIGLAKNSPHPHAAMLFLDFILSRQGQEVFRAVDYLPAHPEIPAKEASLKPGGGRFKKANYIGPDVHFQKGDEWVDIFERLFVK
jgi:ABC-type Fe3+ transport system substrate-binding protein